MRVVLDGGGEIALGTTEAAPTIGIVDYSRRVTNDFGVTTVVERGFARRMSVRLAVPTDAVDRLLQQLAELRSTAALWIADDSYASLTVRGFYNDLAVSFAAGEISFCTLTIEGLTDSTGVADAGGDPAPAGAPSTLQLVDPVALTAPQLVASNVAETDAPEWSASVAYPSGARVMKATTHRVYEAVAAIVAGDDPAAASGHWLDIGPTNRWAMFDQALGSVTTAAGSIVVTLGAQAEAVALLDVIGATVRVQAPGYDRTVPVTKGTIPFLDLPAGTGQVTVTVAGSGDVSVGTLLAGRLIDLGITEASPTAGITDFSRKVIDDFGGVTLAKRSYAKRMSANALIRSDAVDMVAARIAAVRARPCLWIGQAGTDSLTVYGFFKDFSIEIGQSVSKLSLSIEGLSTAGKVAPLGAAINWPDIADPTGTKPADNADVTGENTANDTKHVGPRTALQVADDLDSNGRNWFDLAELTGTRDALYLARLTLNGQPIGTAVLDLTTRFQDLRSATVESIDYIGAKFDDSTAEIAEIRTVVTEANAATSRAVDVVSASVDQLSGSVSDIRSVVIDPDGTVTSKAVLALKEVFGGRTVVAGMVSTLTGGVSSLEMLFDSYNLLAPDGTSLFYATGNLVTMPNVAVGVITYDALVQRFTDVGRQNLDPNGWYQEIPGGLIMQGGRLRRSIDGDGTISVTFPKPFPNQVLATGANGFLSSANRLADLIIQNLGEPSVTGTNFYAQATGSDVSAIQGIDWWAWGK